MLNKIMTLAIVVALTVLLMPSTVGGWGAAHVGRTGVGPGGAYHTGRTVVSGPRGVYGASTLAAAPPRSEPAEESTAPEPGARLDTAARLDTDTAAAPPVGSATPAQPATDTSGSRSVRVVICRAAAGDVHGSLEPPAPLLWWGTSQFGMRWLDTALDGFCRKSLRTEHCGQKPSKAVSSHRTPN
jgi:hypothetical protein